MTRIKATMAEAARQIDKAINLGVSAMYPLVFNMPAPDPPPDWKHVVRVGWKVVRVTAKETTRILKETGFPKLGSRKDDQ